MTQNCDCNTETFHIHGDSEPQPASLICILLDEHNRLTSGLRAVATTHPDPCRTCLSTQAMDEDEGMTALLLHWGQVMGRMQQLARDALKGEPA